MNFSSLNDGSGLTADEQIQAEFAGENTNLIFIREGEIKPFYEASFKQGVTYEWVKNKVADIMESRYEDISLYYKGKRIPEPFCLVDMGVQNRDTITVQLTAGAVIGYEALRLKVLAEIEEEEKNSD